MFIKKDILYLFFILTGHDSYIDSIHKTNTCLFGMAVVIIIKRRSNSFGLWKNRAALWIHPLLTTGWVGIVRW